MNIEFLAHRGMWYEKEEKNTMFALRRSLDEGFGLETDIRDFNGELVISHDVPTGSPDSVESLLDYYRSGGCTSTLALNIKADGLQDKLHRLLQEYGIEKYFVFDMSVPDTLGYLKAGIRTFVRRSELENHPELTRRAQGVWLDELTGSWIDARVISDVSKTADSICVVSGELHGRTYDVQWKEIRSAMIAGCPNLLICTDVPNDAKEFFK